MICANCIHYESCLSWIKHGSMLYNDFDYSVANCPYFEDKSKFVELPCVIGDMVYKLDNHGIVELKVWNTEITTLGVRIHGQCKHLGHCDADDNPCDNAEVCRAVFWDEELGRTVFLKKAEAEAKLKELEDEYDE